MCIGCELSQQLSSCFSQAVLARAGTTSRRRVLQAGALMAASAVAPSLLKADAQAAPAPAPATATSPANGKADWLFEGGTILTMEADGPRAEAVAVRGREIVYVGDRRGARAWVGPATQRVDLKGGTLLPGLIDSHVHPLLGALLRSGLGLKIESREGEVLASITEYVKANPGTGVFFGQGWDQTSFATRADHTGVISMRSVPTNRCSFSHRMVTPAGPIARRWRWRASPPRPPIPRWVAMRVMPTALQPATSEKYRRCCR